MEQKFIDNLRNVRLEIRLTQLENKKLTDCAKRLNTTKIDLLVKGIDLVSEEI